MLDPSPAGVSQEKPTRGLERELAIESSAGVFHAIDVVYAIYITAILNEPADLEVTLGNEKISVHLQKGVNDLQVPSRAGKPPHFFLARGRIQLAQADGDEAISAADRPLDLYYSTGFLSH